MEQYHAQTALTDTATNAQRQLVVQELLMEVKLLSILLALQLKLTQQTLLVNTDTHRTELETATQNRIPDEDITIQSHLAVLSHGAPVIIVRSSAIMLLAIAQLAANALYKYSAILLADCILALLRRKVWIHIEQILRMNEMNILRQERLQLRIMLASQELGTQDGTIDAAHDILEEGDGTVFLGNHSLPVPLVNIERMKIIQLLVSTDGVHICIYAISRLNLILGKRQSLPFGKRMNHLSLGITQILDRETYRALYAVQVIIDTQTLQYEERSGNATQTELGAQVLLEEFFYHFNTHFGLAHIQQRLVPFRFYQIAHFYFIFSICAAKVQNNN